MDDRHNIYEKYDDKNLILRDHLAADRTILANDRTVLAYVRTALTAFVAGLTIIKFFGGIYFQILGWLMLVIGIIISLSGVARCRRNRKYLEKLS